MDATKRARGKLLFCRQGQPIPNGLDCRPKIMPVSGSKWWAAVTASGQSQDRQKLDEYLDSVCTLEKRIHEPGFGTPGAPGVNYA